MALAWTVFAAVFTAAARSERFEELASTSTIEQLGQTDDTISMSRSISWPQPVSPEGSGLVAPFWFSLRKHPLAVVH
ncbi:MAG: hypothetical protein ACREQ5_34050, partial [Candidatus Dormibacteria bacterium]